MHNVQSVYTAVEKKKEKKVFSNVIDIVNINPLNLKNYIGHKVICLKYTAILCFIGRCKGIDKEWFWISHYPTFTLASFFGCFGFFFSSCSLKL